MVNNLCNKLINVTKLISNWQSIMPLQQLLVKVNNRQVNDGHVSANALIVLGKNPRKNLLVSSLLGGEKSAVAMRGPKRFKSPEFFWLLSFRLNLTLMAYFIIRANLGSAIPDPSLGKSIRISLNLQYLKPFMPTYPEYKVTQVFIRMLSVRFAFYINEHTAMFFWHPQNIMSRGLIAKGEL